MPITKTTKTKTTRTKTAKKKDDVKKADLKNKIELKIPKISGKKKKVDVELTREEIGLAVASINAAAKVDPKAKEKLLKLSRDLSGILSDD